MSLIGWLTAFVSDTTMALVEDGALPGPKQFDMGNVGLGVTGHMTHTGSLADRGDLRRGVGIIAARGFLGVQYHGTFILLFSGTDSDARKRALTAKCEEDVGKPLSLLSPVSTILPYVDGRRMRNEIARRFIEDRDLIKCTFGAICHVRLPVVQAAVGIEIPQRSVSFDEGTPHVQALDPIGNLGFAHLADGLAAAGVRYLNATSLNIAGESEITDLAEAEAFCAASGVPLLLVDPGFAARDVIGSFPVVDLERMTAVREGHIPWDLIDRIAGVRFDRTAVSAAKHPQSPYLLGLAERHTTVGPKLRERILDYLYGRV